MSYVKTNWASSDVVSVENLNKIEQGISDAAASSGNSLFVIWDRNNSQWKLDTTLADIASAYLDGKNIWIKSGYYIDEYDPSSFVLEEMWLVYSISNMNNLNDPNSEKYISCGTGTYFFAFSPSEYPVLVT